MNTTVKFDKSFIAPCGMNCGTCMAYLRSKKKCPGCRVNSEDKAVTVKKCIVTSCVDLGKTTSKFCYECGKFPCTRIKQLDKRYTIKYKTSFIENLTYIKEKGLDKFLEFESGRRTCMNCGSVLCVHRENCQICMKN